VDARKGIVIKPVVGNVPRGVEVLIKKAAVDAAFRDVLLDERAAAAARLDLALEPAEKAMLAAIPRAQLEQVIARTTVSAALRPAFLTYAAAVMLAALAAGGCRVVDDNRPKPGGINPDLPPTATAETAATGETASTVDDNEPVIQGIRPDLPEPRPAGIRPDLPPPKSGDK